LFTSDISGTRQWCGRRRLCGEGACGAWGRCRRVSIFGGSASSAADRRNLFLKFRASGGRRTWLRGKVDVDLSQLVVEFVSTAEPLRAREFRPPSNFRFRGNRFASRARL